MKIVISMFFGLLLIVTAIQANPEAPPMPDGTIVTYCTVATVTAHAPIAAIVFRRAPTPLQTHVAANTAPRGASIQKWRHKPQAYKLPPNVPPTIWYSNYPKGLRQTKYIVKQTNYRHNANLDQY